MTPPKQTDTLINNRPARRTLGLTAICLILLGVGLANLLSAVRYLFDGATLAALGVRVPVGLAVLAGLGWGIALVGLALALWLGRNLSVRAVFLLVGAYGVFQVIWWRAFVVADYALIRWPFAVVIMVLFAGGVSGYNWRATRSRVRGGSHQRVGENGPEHRDNMRTLTDDRDRPEGR